MTNIKKLLTNSFFIICFFHLISRLFFFKIYLSENSFYFNENFILALSNQNFIEYFLYQHSIPPGNILLSKIVYEITGGKNLFFFYFFLNSLYSLSALIVLFKIYNLLSPKKKNIFFNFFLILISISFLPYDSWRVNHYDHILVFLYSLTSLFIFNIFLSENKILFNYKFVFLFLLLILFSNLFLIILISIFLVFLIFKKRYIFCFKNIFLSLGIIFLFFFLILLKNKISINDYTPSSIKGWNFIQRPLYTLGYEKYLDLYLKKINLPKENKICVKNIIENNKIDKDKLFLSLVLHKCFFDHKKQIYNYFELKKNLEKNSISNDYLYNAISLDVKDLKTRKWIFSGGHEDINLRTTVAFHKESLKVYLSSFVNYPFEMLFGSVSTTQNQGVFFTFLNMFKFGGQLPYYYEYEHKNFDNQIFKFFQIFFSIIIILGFLLTLNILVKAFFFLFTKRKILKFDILIFTLFSIIISYNLATSLITCCENQRNAVQISPLILTMVSLSFFKFFRKNKLKMKYN
jgi:hypothetical protein